MATFSSPVYALPCPFHAGQLRAGFVDAAQLAENRGQFDAVLTALVIGRLMES
jgi:hypothetical protein